MTPEQARLQALRSVAENETKGELAQAVKYLEHLKGRAYTDNLVSQLPHSIRQQID